MADVFNFERDKDQLIARLILQKALMYVQATDGWLDELITWHEAYIVVTYTSEGDKEVFKDTYDEIKRYLDEGILTPAEGDEDAFKPVT